MIELRGVSFSYSDGAQGGLKDITLSIPDGQCVLLCGRSGCGKTTLTRLINGLIPHFFPGELHGEVLLDGTRISDLPMYRIAEKVGSVFQNPRWPFQRAIRPSVEWRSAYANKQESASATAVKPHPSGMAR